MNYTRYSREMHLFVRGELRTDGWISDWKKEQILRRREDVAKPKLVKPVVKVVKISQKQKKYPRQHPNSYYFKRQCSVCDSPIRHDNKTGRCVHHKLERPQPLEIAYQCGACDKLIRKSEYGVCKKCFTKYRRRIQQQHPRCAECRVIIRMNTKYGLCQEHAKPLHNKHEAAMRKIRRHQLKQAA